MLFYQCCFVLYFVAVPGEVYISSVDATCNSVTIHWVLPLDENDRPYDVVVKYSYPKKRSPVRQTYSGSSARGVVRDLPSDTLVKFSFRAVTKNEKKGPAAHYFVKTLKPSESTLCYAGRVHYICVRIRTYNFIRYSTIHLMSSMFVDKLVHAIITHYIVGLNTCFGFLKLYILLYEMGKAVYDL